MESDGGGNDLFGHQRSLMAETCYRVITLEPNSACRKRSTHRKNVQRNEEQSEKLIERTTTPRYLVNRLKVVSVVLFSPLLPRHYR
jgi:hypothetical protein